MKKIILLMVLWLVCGGMFGQDAIAQTEPPTPDDDVYDGIDILFIIDQSGSMGGAAFGLDPQFASAPTDPQNLRFLAPQFAIQELSLVRLSQVVEPLPDIHVAVMAFGDGTEQLMGWTALVPEDAFGNLVSADVWNEELDNLYDILSAQRFGFRNLGFTDFNNAFDSARDFFQAMPLTLAPQSGETRLRAVVILTDGASCTYDDIYSQVPENPSYNCNDVLYDGTAQRHMEQLAQQARNYFPAPGYEIFVVALDRGLVYADVVKPWWDSVVCQGLGVCDTDLQNKNVVDEIELSAQLNRVISQVVGYLVPTGNVTPIDITCCPPSAFTVLPYQKLLRLNIFKNQPNPLPSFTITNTSLGTKVLTDRIGLDTLIETHTIRNPQPGQYLITADSYDLIRDLSLDSVSFSTNITPPVISPDPLMALNTITIQTGILGADNQPLGLYKDNAGNQLYPLTMELRLYQATGYPDINSRPLVASFPMALDSTSIHTYTATYVLNDTFNGLYDLRLNATFIGNDSNTYTILNNYLLKRELDIQGAYVDTWALEPNSQRAEREIKARALILNQQTRQPISNASMLVLRLQALALDGTVVIQPTVLPNSSTTGGVVEGVFTINTPGGYSVSAELGFLDSLGNFIALGPTSNMPIEIRAPQSVTLTITQPNTSDIVAQSLTLFPPEWVNNPNTVIQVEIRDQNGVGIDLSSLTGIADDVPTVNLVTDGTSTDLTSQLQRFSTGVYALTTDRIGLGEHRLEVYVEEQTLLGDYQWGSVPNASFTFTRSISPSVITSIVGLVVGVLAIIIGFFLVGRLVANRSRYPATGKIVIRAIRIVEGEEYPEAPIEFDLNTRSLHTQTFKNRGKVKVLSVTTGPNEEYSRSGTVKIIELEIEDMPIGQMNIPPILGRGDMRELGQVATDNGIKRYIIEKDMLGSSWSPPSSFEGRGTKPDYVDINRGTEVD